MRSRSSPKPSIKLLPRLALTTFRMPYTPVTFGTLAGASRGDLFDPVRRRRPMTGRPSRARCSRMWALETRALFPESGEDMDATVARETQTVRAGRHLRCVDPRQDRGGRAGCGRVPAPHVRQRWKLEPGRCRYGMLLTRPASYRRRHRRPPRPRPLPCDDHDRWSARVLALMEDYLQTEWPDLQVWLTSTTEQWAVIAVQGPRARAVIAPLVAASTLDRRAAPHVGSGVRDRRRPGPPFPGELHRRARLRAECTSGLRPSGVGGGLGARARRGRLRLRHRGHACPARGEGLHHCWPGDRRHAIPDDLGLGWAVGKAKPDFVGKRSLSAARHAAGGS